MSEEEIVRLAKARAGFKAHALVFVLVNTFLFCVWALTTLVPNPSVPDSGTFYWPIWPLLGWGLGLSIHAFFAMGPGQRLQAREEQRLRSKYGH